MTETSLVAGRHAAQGSVHVLLREATVGVQVPTGMVDNAEVLKLQGDIDPLKALAQLGRVLSGGFEDKELVDVLQEMAETMAAHSQDMKLHAPEPPTHHALGDEGSDELPAPLRTPLAAPRRRLGTPEARELTADEKAERKRAVEAERLKQKASKLESAGAIVYLPSDNDGVDWSSMAGCAASVIAVCVHTAAVCPTMHACCAAKRPCATEHRFTGAKMLLISKRFAGMMSRRARLRTWC